MSNETTAFVRQAPLSNSPDIGMFGQESLSQHFWCRPPEIHVAIAPGITHKTASGNGPIPDTETEVSDFHLSFGRNQKVPRSQGTYTFI